MPVGRPPRCGMLPTQVDLSTPELPETPITPKPPTEPETPVIPTDPTTAIPLPAPVLMLLAAFGALGGVRWLGRRRG